MKGLHQQVELFADDAHALAGEVERAASFAARAFGQAAAAGVRLVAFSLGVAVVLHYRFLTGGCDVRR